MATSKLIVVVGATGKQGGSVVNSFSNETGWRVRGLTRNPSGANAQALAARGVEVVQADLEDPSTLRSAFQGANAIFIVSDFWSLYFNPNNQGKAQPGQPLNVLACEQEEKQLRNAIDAAAGLPTLERLVFSGLCDPTKWSHGKYTHVYHFESKARAAAYGAKAHPNLWAKTSIFQAGLFLTNLTTDPFSKPIKAASGHVQFMFPLDLDNKLPFIASEEDSGPISKALIQSAPGKNLIGYRGWLTLRDFAGIFAQVTGAKAEAVQLPTGDFRAPMPEDLKLEFDDMFGFINEFGYEGRDDPSVVHPRDLEYPPKLDSVADWIKKQDWAKVLGE